VVRLNIDESLSKIFTPKRIALFNAITGRETIKSLEKKLNRNPKSIARDIAILEDFGIVRKKKRGRSRTRCKGDCDFQVMPKFQSSP